MAGDLHVHPVTTQRLDDVADLFSSASITRGCWCMYFIATTAEFRDGWRSGRNREHFEQLAAGCDAPVGLLAYRDGEPVGWCACGPRSRYRRAVGPRARVLADRDPAEDDAVWLVPCFLTRVGHRRQGVTNALLDAAVQLASSSGAPAIEGFPRAAGQRPSPDDFLGREEQFAAHGFTSIARPTPQRVVMRRRLS